MANTYATWNPLDKASSITLSNENLTATCSEIAGQSVRATQGKSTGKHYFLARLTTYSNTQVYLGLMNGTATTSVNVGTTTDGWAYTSFGSGTQFVYGKVFNNIVSPQNLLDINDYLGIAWDADAGKIWFRRNNVWLSGGDPTAGTSPDFTGVTGTLFPTASFNGAQGAWVANFGASTFAYAPPSGFNAGWFTSGTPSKIFSSAPLNGLGSGGSLLTERLA